MIWMIEKGLIYLFSGIITTAISGAILQYIWEKISSMMECNGFIRMNYVLLLGYVGFYIIYINFERWGENFKKYEKFRYLVKRKFRKWQISVEKKWEYVGKLQRCIVHGFQHQWFMEVFVRKFYCRKKFY